MSQDSWRQILRLGHGDKAQVIAILSPSAHPGAWVAARELSAEVFVLTRRQHPHAITHGLELGKKLRRAAVLPAPLAGTGVSAVLSWRMSHASQAARSDVGQPRPPHQRAKGCSSKAELQIDHVFVSGNSFFGVKKSKVANRPKRVFPKFRGDPSEVRGANGRWKFDARIGS